MSNRLPTHVNSLRNWKCVWVTSILNISTTHTVNVGCFGMSRTLLQIGEPLFVQYICLILRLERALCSRVSLKRLRMVSSSDNFIDKLSSWGLVRSLQRSHVFQKVPPLKKFVAWKFAPSETLGKVASGNSDHKVLHGCRTFRNFDNSGCTTRWKTKLLSLSQILACDCWQV